VAGPDPSADGLGRPEVDHERHTPRAWEAARSWGDAHGHGLLHHGGSTQLDAPRFFTARAALVRGPINGRSNGAQVTLE